MSPFDHAPSPKFVDGLFAVPIHIDGVTASIVFAADTGTTLCVAEMQFTVGPDSGYPFFDLRQTIETALLDGTPLPASDLGHHDFAGGPNCDLRILESWLDAGTSHTLSLTYTLGTPSSPNARAILWDAGRLSFSFHLSDLNPARYLESWLPSNLLFDTFAVELEIQVTGSAHAHTVLSNADLTTLGSNHWQLDFPATFASCSPMLLIEASDRVTLYDTTITVGGSAISAELMKPVSDTLDLPTQAGLIEGHLNANSSSIGSYMHGNRFVAFLTSGSTHSMEYDGATTSRDTALAHEVFHSWWARGLIPASGDDGWLDEGWTTYNTRSSGPDAVALDPSGLPVTLWQNNRFVRETPDHAYSAGADIFSSVAADLGIASLQSHMAGIFQDRIGRHFTTPMVEAELIRRSGYLPIADTFDRYVYGFGDLPAGAPDLYLRDNTDDSGLGSSSGIFWRSPDVWVRNSEDDVQAHQNPESGQDNWFYARVHNRGTATARSFVVGFKVNIWAGTEFVYPGDWFPLNAAVVGFDLSPGATKIVKARWPAADIPPVDSHGCLLALVYNSDDAPVAGHHVWTDPNLAQRNMTVVDLIPGETGELVFRLGSAFRPEAGLYSLELVRPPRWVQIEVAMSHRVPHRLPSLYRSAADLRASLPKAEPIAALELPMKHKIRLDRAGTTLTAAAGSRLRLGSTPHLAHTHRMQARLVGNGEESAIQFDPGRRAALSLGLAARQREALTLRFTAPESARPGESIVLDLVQRNAKGQAVGGISVQLNIRSPRGCRS